MCTTVLLSLAARQKLEQRLAATPCEVGRRMSDIARRLRRIFPAARAAVVQDLYGGYRVRDGEFVLLVELSESGPHDGRYVVKIGPEENLRAELAAWRECRPAGLRHDLVLMPIEPRPDEEHIEGLVYADAQQFIGVDQTLPLEAAMLDAARVGFPTPSSVGDLLFHLYERLGVVLYRYSAGDPPPQPRKGMTLAELGLDRHLGRNLDQWTARADPRDPFRARLAFETRAYASMYADDTDRGERFRDPVDLFRAVERHVARGGAPADLVPILLRGRGHGDLHGRNVLVGRVGDRVLWPAVYDHEHMGKRNLVGWDFVKLETEFKVRAYPLLFPGLPRASVPAVVRFERALFAKTEECREVGAWPEKPEAVDPAGWAPVSDEADRHAARLAWLILKVREAAGRHLGLLRGRTREWLAEYYFLLALYGLNAIRFANLEATELRAAYLSAGAACARYVYDRERPTGAPAPAGDPAAPLSHHAELAHARVLWRATSARPDLEQARDLLRDLRTRHPHVLAVAHELVLVLERLGDLDAAVGELGELERTFPGLDEETLARGGRIHKTLAVRAAPDAAGLARAVGLLESAERYYRRAFEVRRGFYPRVNELTVRFLRAAKLAELGNVTDAGRVLRDVRADAADMLKDPGAWAPHRDDDVVWVAATRGEAAFLCGDWPAAESFYAEARTAARGKAFHLRAMGGQLRLLLAACEKLNVAPPAALADPDALLGV